MDGQMGAASNSLSKAGDEPSNTTRIPTRPRRKFLCNLFPHPREYADAWMKGREATKAWALESLHFL